MKYDDILYNARDGVAHITIDRPEKYNAFRGQTCDELIHAFNRAGWDNDIGLIALGGAGNKAFCTGGDQSAHEGSYEGRGTIGLPMEELRNGSERPEADESQYPNGKDREVCSRRTSLFDQLPV